MKIKIRIVFGICSYLVALVLLLTPFISDPHLPAAARIIPFLGGSFLFAGTLVTDFELGLTRLMRFRDTVGIVLVGCTLILISGMVINYGQMLWLLTMLVCSQGLVSLLAYTMHSNSRPNIA